MKKSTSAAKARSRNSSRSSTGRVIELRAPEARSFDVLQDALLDIVGHLQCADGVLYDLQNVPEELQPACIVLHRAATELDRLYNRIDEWSVTHTYRPKTAADREALAAWNTRGMTAAEGKRYRATLRRDLADAA